MADDYPESVSLTIFSGVSRTLASRLAERLGEENDKQYEGLREKGMSKERAAKIVGR
jgi:hypothetical protein